MPKNSVYCTLIDKNVWHKKIFIPDTTFKLLNTHSEITGAERMYRNAVNEIENICKLENKNCYCKSWCSDDWLKDKQLNR